LSLRVGFAAAATIALALSAPVTLAADRDVVIDDFAFSPGSVEIRAGDTVTWINRDAVPHTATARNGSFDTGLFGEGESRAVRFRVPGTYRYVCTPHPDMTGTVVVRAPATGVRPPNTATADGVETTGDASRLAGLAGLGAVAYLFARRALAGRGRISGPPS
jgi:plastocyanin